MKALIVFLCILYSLPGVCGCPKLDECKQVVIAQDSMIKDQITQIQNYTELTGLQQKIIDDQKKELSSPLHDPVKVAIGTTILVLLVEFSLGAFHN